ncbi:MAG: hypothetical protein ABJH98_13300 [Reichenbachiella sp.]|uniref:hypothetical protein n=1 Tax=Reichenbachiella sp. TaxID=2184521 RepID=UPI0032998A3C
MKFTVIFLLSTLLSCVSPYKIHKLKPIGERSYWDWGRHYAISEVNNLELKIAYENNTWDELGFNIEVINKREDTVLVEPEIFFIEYLEVLSENSHGAIRKSIDPEKKITELEKQISRHKADEINTATRQLFEVVLEVASDVSESTQNKTDEEKIQKDIERQQNREWRDSENQQLKLQQMSLNQKRKYYDMTLLRKTSLPPNTKIFGKSNFILSKTAKFYRVYIPIEMDTMIFEFEQNILTP